MVEDLNWDERTDSFWENTWGGKFLWWSCLAFYLMIRNSQDVAFVWLSQGKLDTVKDFWGKNNWSNNTFYLWLTCLGLIVPILDLEALIKENKNPKQRDNTHLTDCCQNKIMYMKRHGKLRSPWLMWLLCFGGLTRREDEGSMWFWHQAAWVITLLCHPQINHLTP